MTKKESHHLEELSHKHFYDIADDQPDITHWNIVDESSKKIGEVKDLLFDKDTMKARYLITNLKDGIFEEDRKVLIPVGRARLNTADRIVEVPKVTPGQILSLPDYTGPTELTAEDEYAIRHSFAGTEPAEDATGAYNRNTFYNHEDFDDRKFYKEST